MIRNKYDFKFNSDFDLELGRDIKLSSKLDYQIRLLQIRLHGTNPDFVLHPHMCSSLEEFIGENNDSETGSSIIKQVTSSLTSDGAFVNGNLFIDAYPLDYHTIKCEVECTVEDGGKSEYISEGQEITL